MRFGNPILSPNHLRQWDFDSITSEEHAFEFKCAGCSATVMLFFDTLIGREFGWREEYSPETVSQIEKYFGMNLVSKTPDGGWTAITESKCESCGTDHIIYAGVREYANSAYRVTIQGICELK